MHYQFSLLLSTLLLLPTNFASPFVGPGSVEQCKMYTASLVSDTHRALDSAGNNLVIDTYNNDETASDPRMDNGKRWVFIGGVLGENATPDTGSVGGLVFNLGDNGQGGAIYSSRDGNELKTDGVLQVIRNEGTGVYAKAFQDGIQLQLAANLDRWVTQDGSGTSGNRGQAAKFLLTESTRGWATRFCIGERARTPWCVICGSGN